MRRLILFLTALALAVAGCGGSDDISIDSQWARNSPMNAKMGAAYMNITSADGDVLVGGSVDSGIAERVEIHAMMAMDGASDEEGMAMMEMVEIPRLELPAGEAAVLKPGGYHVMFINIAQPFEIGQVIDLTLHFEKGDDVTVAVEVMEEGP